MAEAKQGGNVRRVPRCVKSCRRVLAGVLDQDDAAAEMSLCPTWRRGEARLIPHRKQHFTILQNNIRSFRHFRQQESSVTQMQPPKRKDAKQKTRTTKHIGEDVRVESR